MTDMHCSRCDTTSPYCHRLRQSEQGDQALETGHMSLSRQSDGRREQGRQPCITAVRQRETGDRDLPSGAYAAASPTDVPV